MEFTLGVNVHALGRDSSAGLTADEVDAWGAMDRGYASRWIHEQKNEGKLPWEWVCVHWAEIRGLVWRQMNSMLELEV